MKLLNARFQNFRLLRDLEIDFSHGTERSLTVIRAENESGKTTILNALQWGLYGNDGLPPPARQYRLHPVDWDDSSGPAQITVTVDFETTNEWRGLLDKKTYRIVRSLIETPVGTSWERGPETVTLYEIGPTGATSAPQAIIEQELPRALREVFFTDGDKALNFVDTNDPLSARRKRVAGAIHSLLGLEVIQEALRHVRACVTATNRQAKGIGDNVELDRIQSELVDIGELKEKLEVDIINTNDEYARFQSSIAKLRSSMDDAFAKADQDKLKDDIKQCEERILTLEAAIDRVKSVHSGLFRSADMACGLLGPILQQGLARLEELRKQGEFPKTSIPVLEERLRSMVCICGETLAEHDVQGRRRRNFIEALVEETRQADGLQSILTEMYFGSEQMLNRPDSWLDLYKNVSEDRYNIQAERTSEGQHLQALKSQVKDVQNVDLQELMQTLEQLETQKDQALMRKVEHEAKLGALKETETDLERRSTGLLRRQDRGAVISATRGVARDVEFVLDNAFEKITRQERAKVSSLMNKLFLDMIGADPEQSAIINEAKISPEDDIVVLGPNERPIQDSDVNGASRRALTLAFIMALTEVSEVEAPNIVDTPLGMMSGFVKQSVLRIAIERSSQLVLFLTRSEIAGCEEILDNYAGRVITLTNSTHYPTMLMNDPRVEARCIMRCECDHRSSCSVCLRRSIALD